MSKALSESESTLAERAVFRAVVGNPPYQSSTGIESVQNIFHEAQEITLLVSEYSSLIYPAGRWIMRSGKGMREFGDYLLNSPRLRSLRYFDARETLQLFPGTLIRDGVGIVLVVPEAFGNSESFQLNGELLKRPGTALIPVEAYLARVVEKLREQFPRTVREGILSRGHFGIESSFAEINPNKVLLVSESIYPPKHMSDPIKLFTNDKSGALGRTKWFWVERDEITRGREELGRWKVITRSGIQGHEDELEFLVAPPETAIARSHVIVRTFTSEREAQGLKSYLQTDFAKLMFSASMVGRLSALGVFVPDIAEARNPRTGLTGWDSHWNDDDLKELFGEALKGLS